jgi:hypothetical protein
MKWVVKSFTAVFLRGWASAGQREIVTKPPRSDLGGPALERRALLGSLLSKPPPVLSARLMSKGIWFHRGFRNLLGCRGGGLC